MKLTIACAVLAAAAWAVYATGRGRDAALVFAVVWTAMALAYAARTWRGQISN
jgi:hypothetical protein